jgi:hypothetical protein
MSWESAFAQAEDDQRSVDRTRDAVKAVLASLT